jgi:hypothetical protein
MRARIAGPRRKAVVVHMRTTCVVFANRLAWSCPLDTHNEVRFAVNIAVWWFRSLYTQNAVKLSGSKKKKIMLQPLEADPCERSGRDVQPQVKQRVPRVLDKKRTPTPLRRVHFAVGL